jgi:putative MATE family efflux protein
MPQHDKAAATIRTQTAISLFFTAVFLLLGIFASGPLFRGQTDVAEIAQMGTVYLTINWVLSCGSIFSKYYERLLVSAGRSSMSMAAMASGAVFNLVFDPLLIFGIGPFPELGIAGAAYATVGGQIFAALVAIVLNLKYNETVARDMFRPVFHVRAAADILRVGLPSIITMGLASVTSFFVNQILLAYSTTATAVYGVWMKLQNFCYMPIFGLNNGMVPILSYNYGIRRLDRVKQTMRLAVLSSAALMCLLMLVFELIPGTILSMFSAGEQMREIGMVCLRACVFSLPFGAVSMLLATSMQALDHSRYTMLINLLRSCVLLIGCFYLLSARTHSQKLIWLAVPVTEVVTFAISLALNRRFHRDLKLE